VPAVAAPAAAETAAQIAARAAEAHETEIDALVADIIGDPTYVARSANQRKERMAEAAADTRLRAQAAARAAEAEAIAARIAAA